MTIRFVLHDGLDGEINREVARAVSVKAAQSALSISTGRKEAEGRRCSATLRLWQRK